MDLQQRQPESLIQFRTERWDFAMSLKTGKPKAMLSDETVRAISSVVRSAIAEAMPSGYEGINKLFYGLGEAADMLGMDRTTLNRLSKTHPVYMPQERSNGLKRPVYSNHQRAMSESFALGTVRIISGAAKEEELERFTKWLQGVTKEYHPAAIVGSGGNINKVFKILEKKEKEPLKLNELKTLFTRLSKLSYDERVTKCGLNPYRADVIMPALEIFLTAARTCKIDEVIVPKIGLADGIIHRLYRQFK